MAAKPPANGVIWIFFLGVFLIFLGVATAAHGATPTHKYDPKFSLTFSADWNLKHPKWPITDMACLLFPAESAKSVGAPGAGTGVPSVPAHEDCMFSERIAGRATTQCGEVTIKVRYVPNNPDAALIAGTPIPCREVRQAIKAIRTANNQGTA